MFTRSIQEYFFSFKIKILEQNPCRLYKQSVFSLPCFVIIKQSSTKMEPKQSCQIIQNFIGAKPKGSV